MISGLKPGIYWIYWDPSNQDWDLLGPKQLMPEKLGPKQSRLGFIGVYAMKAMVTGTDKTGDSPTKIPSGELT